MNFQSGGGGLINEWGFTEGGGEGGGVNRSLKKVT